MVGRAWQALASPMQQRLPVMFVSHTSFLSCNKQFNLCLRASSRLNAARLYRRLASSVSGKFVVSATRSPLLFA